MSVEKAKEFLAVLAKDKELQEKFSGFSLDDLKKAAEEMKASSELSDDDLDSVAGGLAVSVLAGAIA